MTEQERFTQWWEKQKGNSLIQFAYDDFVYIVALESWRSARRWIPVEEELPEKSGGVLIFNHGCENACYSKELGIWETDEEDEAEPTHWQPLPAPPEAE